MSIYSLSLFYKALLLLLFTAFTAFPLLAGGFSMMHDHRLRRTLGDRTTNFHSVNRTTMSLTMTFGKHEGRLFFKQPGYAQWIYENGIHRQDHFGEEEGDYFLHLYERATHLAGTCCRCHKRAVTRMGLTTSFKHGELLAVGFFCDECEHLGGASTGYHRPSFFVEAYTLKAWEQNMVQSEIVRHYISGGNLTQKKMEEFFADEGNFAEPIPSSPRQQRFLV